MAPFVGPQLVAPTAAKPVQYAPASPANLWVLEHSAPAPKEEDDLRIIWWERSHSTPQRSCTPSLLFGESAKLPRMLLVLRRHGKTAKFSFLAHTAIASKIILILMIR